MDGASQDVPENPLALRIVNKLVYQHTVHACSVSVPQLVGKR